MDYSLGKVKKGHRTRAVIMHSNWNEHVRLNGRANVRQKKTLKDFGLSREQRGDMQLRRFSDQRKRSAMLLLKARSGIR